MGGVGAGDHGRLAGVRIPLELGFGNAAGEAQRRGGRRVGAGPAPGAILLVMDTGHMAVDQGGVGIARLVPGDAAAQVAEQVPPWSVGEGLFGGGLQAVGGAVEA